MHAAGAEELILKLRAQMAFNELIDLLFEGFSNRDENHCEYREQQDVLRRALPAFISEKACGYSFC